ncbi:hypothetical protein H6F93_23215 [Leptolyngbya sp. FACHB-671]|uniref:hypothetical protein n=1 Tax=Leptolyngbya sp. FACHB-671 TaxID=2692812 RepID=UPI0016870F94|nr:hypothetical protein [Leptolyngbya sp. FACHB-671]MBD2070384.1 hypothetical protein [Leptolyngbya sp. FACHB-671]
MLNLYTSPLEPQSIVHKSQNITGELWGITDEPQSIKLNSQNIADEPQNIKPDSQNIVDEPQNTKLNVLGSALPHPTY